MMVKYTNVQVHTWHIYKCYREKIISIILFILMQIHNDPETLATMPPVRNSPIFVELTVADGESSYFLFMEQAVICSVKSFTKALFLWFALYYIFNLEYEKYVEVGMFFQGFVFGLPYPAKKNFNLLGHRHSENDS